MNQVTVILFIRLKYLQRKTKYERLAKLNLEDRLRTILYRFEQCSSFQRQITD